MSSDHTEHRRAIGCLNIHQSFSGAISRPHLRLLVTFRGQPSDSRFLRPRGYPVTRLQTVPQIRVSSWTNKQALRRGTWGSTRRTTVDLRPITSALDGQFVGFATVWLSSAQAPEVGRDLFTNVEKCHRFREDESRPLGHYLRAGNNYYWHAMES